MKLIDKDALVAEIERLISKGRVKLQESQESNDYESYVVLSEHIATCRKVLSLLDTLEVKEVDLEKETTHYLLHEHRSPLNEIMHKADLKSEMQYHKDIENAFKAGFELGISVSNKAQKGE